MNLRIGTLILAVGLCLVGPGSAGAGRFFVQAHGGASLVNLDDINDAIDRVNAGAGSDLLDPIDAAWDLGLHAGYDLTPELALGLGYARLAAGSDFSQNGYLGSFDMPADLYEIFLDFVPAGPGNVKVGAGVTTGMVTSRAAVSATEPESGTAVLSFDGQGFLFAGYGILDVALSPRFGLVGRGGFRHAVINTLKVDGNVAFNPDSLDDKLRFSYSGFFLRVGVRFRP